MNTFSAELVVVATGVAFFVLLGSLMAFYIRRRDVRYDEKLHRIELEMFRRSIENEISELNDRMLSTEARWKDANHLLISSQEALSKSPRSQSILSRFNIDEDIEVERNLVFVLTPFNDSHSATYNTIAQTCMRLGLNAIRGDEHFIGGEVFPHILRWIACAQIVIANIDGRNPNVFYELGIAHSLGKQTILISKRPEDVPFDIRTNRIVIYRDSRDLSERLQLELARALTVKS